jgi:hypothetical protein
MIAVCSELCTACQCMVECDNCRANFTAKRILILKSESQQHMLNKPRGSTPAPESKDSDDWIFDCNFHVYLRLLSNQSCRSGRRAA